MWLLRKCLLYYFSLMKKYKQVKTVFKIKYIPIFIISKYKGTFQMNIFFFLPFLPQLTYSIETNLPRFIPGSCNTKPVPANSLWRPHTRSRSSGRLPTPHTRKPGVPCHFHRKAWAVSVKLQAGKPSVKPAF